MSEQYPGGFITKSPPTPAGPYQTSSAYGMWTLSQQAAYQKEGLWPIAGNVVPIALIGGGYATSASNVIQYVNITTTGNASDFGDLSFATWALAACGTSTRSVFAGGQGGPSDQKTIEYVNPATTGNSVGWGASCTYVHFGASGANSTTRGLIAAGEGSTNHIEYITIATTGSVSTFGTIARAANYGGSTFSQTRAIFPLSDSNAISNSMDYVTIATTGNGVTFGQLTAGRQGVQGCSNGTRGIFGAGTTVAGSTSYVNIIDYVTIATTGNATDFGDLTDTIGYISSTSSPTRGLFLGGNNNSGKINVIQYVTIATTGNATDFGDLLLSMSATAATSTANGGLQ
jgi:hypothetical protein